MITSPLLKHGLVFKSLIQLCVQFWSHDTRQVNYWTSLWCFLFPFFPCLWCRRLPCFLLWCFLPRWRRRWVAAPAPTGRKDSRNSFLSLLCSFSWFWSMSWIPPPPSGPLPPMLSFASPLPPPPLFPKRWENSNSDPAPSLAPPVDSQSGIENDEMARMTITSETTFAAEFMLAAGVRLKTMRQWYSQ